MRSTPTPRPQAGFTLLEVLLAMAISAAAIVTVGMTFEATLRAKTSVDNLSNSTSVGPRIMALLERDLGGLWHHNIKNNRIFVGRNMDIGGIEADRLDFLTCTDSVGYVVDSNSRELRPSICEVGYWLRPHPRYPELMELWRREDPMVDDDLMRGGRFQLVSDRIKEFKILHYETLGYEAEEKFEWDSSERDTLPRRIKVEFVVEPLRTNRNAEAAFEIEDPDRTEQRFVRHFVFDRRYSDVLAGGVAMKPVIPGPPEENNDPGQAGSGDLLNPGAGSIGDLTQGAGGNRGQAGRGDAGRGANPGARGNTGFPGEGGGRGGGQDAGRGNPGANPGANRGNVPANPFGGNTLPPGFNLGDLLRGGD